jgi:hypothetical protein
MMPRPPPTPPFQFNLRTLLLLCVVLGSSLAVFGAWGIAVFGLVVGLAGLLRWASDLRPLIYLNYHTIMLVEAANSGIQWAEPEDLLLDTLGATGGRSSALALSSNDVRRKDEFFFTYDYAPGICVAMADSSVRFVRTGTRSPDELRKILQIGGYNDKEISADENYEGSRRLNWPNIAARLVWLFAVGTLLVGAVRSRKSWSVVPTPAGSTSGPRVE